MTSHSKSAPFGAARFARAGLVNGLVQLVATWRGRSKARRALARLDDHLLHDIGLDRLSARDEATRRFWQD